MITPLDWNAARAASHLRMPTDDDDKYSRGVVGMRTGSVPYPGAAVLGVEAAWRAGAGMVRYIGPDPVGDAVLARRPETVRGEGRVQAWVIGSGTDASVRDAEETAALRGVLSGVVPVVADAGALDLVVGARAPLVVTPHGREFARLREYLGLAPAGEDRVAAAVETAATLDAVVLLKGARTIVATGDGWVASVAAGTPWLATAGTGDVLAGVMGALVAARSDAAADDPVALASLAATAAWVHGAAGRRAAGQGEGGPGHPLVALEVADAVPAVVGQLLRAM